MNHRITIALAAALVFLGASLQAAPADAKKIAPKLPTSTVVKDGLAFTVTAAKPSFALDEFPAFDVEIKNVSKAAVSFTTIGEGWPLCGMFTQIGVLDRNRKPVTWKPVWNPEVPRRGFTPPPAKRTLQPGKSFKVRVAYGPRQVFKNNVDYGIHKHLREGQYSVVFSRFIGAGNRTTAVFGQSSRIGQTTKPVTFRVGKAKPLPTSTTVKGNWSITVTAGKAEFAADDPLTFDVAIKNVGKNVAACLIYSDNPNPMEWQPCMQFTAVVPPNVRMVPKTWKVQWDSKRFPRPPAHPGIPVPTPISLRPGETHSIKINIGATWNFTNQDKKIVAHLPTWKYSATFSYTLKGIGLITTDPVVIVVRKKPATDGDEAVGGNWKDIGGDWYKRAKGKEQVFTGKLEAIPPMPEGLAGITMRHLLYKLGDRQIYTGGRKIPALDKLVGKQVTIRGKAVDMNLEGQQLKELWPTAVRAATTRPVQLPVPRDLRVPLPPPTIHKLREFRPQPPMQQ